MVLQLAAYRWQRPILGPSRLEEMTYCAKDQSRQGRILVQATDAFDVFHRRATAVVADTVEADELVQWRYHLPGAMAHVLVQPVALSAVLEGDAEGQHPRAVAGFPPEEATGQVLLLRAGPQEDVMVQPTFLEDLWQHPMVPKTIDAVAHAGGDAEPGAEVALPEQCLPDERFAAGDVAVGFDPPATDDLPAALRDPRPNLVEHRRIDLLHPGVKGRRASGEAEILILAHPVQRRAKGRQDLVKPLGPVPQPHRVDVGIAYHVENLVLRGHFSNPLPPCAPSSPPMSCAPRTACAAHLALPTLGGSPSMPQR